MSAAVSNQELKRTPSTLQVIESLREEAIKNPVFNAMCHVFAARERARQQVTITSLNLTMIKEGFKYQREDYEKCLRFLASLGIGKVDLDSNKKFRSLKEIKITLQSIGQVVLTKKAGFETFHPNARFQALKESSNGHTATVMTMPKDESLELISSYRAKLVVMFDGVPFSFELPRKLTTREINKMLEGFIVK